MVDRDEAELAGQLHAPAVRQLVGVEASAQAAVGPGGEDGSRLVDVEGAVLAEHVDPPGVRCGRREHGAGDEVDVVLGGGVSLELDGDDVGAEEGRVLGELAGHREAARLVVDRQPVSALDLDGGGALGPHLGDEPGDVGGELLVGGGTGPGDRGADAAGRVGLAGHPRLELGGAVAGEDEVAVRVDEAGDHRAPAGVDLHVGGGCLGGRTDPRDPAALDDDGGVVHAARGGRPPRPAPGRWWRARRCR